MQVESEDGPAAGRVAEEVGARELHHRAHTFDARVSARDRDATHELACSRHIEVERKVRRRLNADLKVEERAGEAETGGRRPRQRQVVGRRGHAAQGEDLLADDLVDGELHITRQLGELPILLEELENVNVRRGEFVCEHTATSALRIRPR